MATKKDTWRNNFFTLLFCCCFWIWDPGWVKSGSGVNIPDPQHCVCTALKESCVTYFYIFDKNIRYSKVDWQDSKNPLSHKPLLWIWMRMDWICILIGLILVQVDKNDPKKEKVKKFIVLKVDVFLRGGGFSRSFTSSWRTRDKY